MCVQVPQVVTNLVFHYSEKGFAPLDPILQSINCGGGEEKGCSEQRVKEVVELLSLLLSC